MNKRWKILGKLTTLSPLHIGSGDTVHHPDLKNDDKNVDVQSVVTLFDQVTPCIPGSAIKGVLRSWARKHCSQDESVTRIFGTENGEQGTAGWAEFCTAVIEKVPDDAAYRQFVPYWQADRMTGILSHVCIDRKLGTASYNKLFYEEFIPEGVSFSAEIDATRLSDKEIEFLLGILEFGAKHPTHPWQLGANTANGWGRMKWERLSVTCCDVRPTKIVKSGFGHCEQTIDLKPGSIKADLPEFLTFDLEIECEQNFLVNDASRSKPPGDESGLTNFTPLRKPDGKLWLPASSLRGAIRQKAEFLLRSLNPGASGDPNGNTGGGPIERLFGSTGMKSNLEIQEPVEIVVDDDKSAATQHVDFVAIDRFRGGAAEGAKFDATVAVRPKFKTQLVLKDPGLSGPDYAIFIVALRDLMAGQIALGMGGSKGMGHSKAHVSGIQVSPGVKAKLATGLLAEELDAAGKKWLQEQLEELKKEEGESSPGEDKSEGWLWVSQSRTGWEYEINVDGNPTKRTSIAEAEVDESLRGKPLNFVPVYFRGNPESPFDVLPRQQQEGDQEQNREKKRADESRNEPLEPVRFSPQVQKQGRFANPFNFIRMVERNDFAKSAPDLADQEPVGQDRWIPNLISGKLKIRMTVQNPVIVCDDAKKYGGEESDHWTYPVKVDASVKPVIESTSVRGMIRSAYEIVTNSRLGVFPFKLAEELTKQGNIRKLGYRMSAREGISLVPARVNSIGDATLMMGDTDVIPEYNSRFDQWSVNGKLYAAWVPQYVKNEAGLARHAIKINGQPIRHRQPGWCLLESMRKETSDNRVIFRFWRVRSAAGSEAGLPDQVDPSPNRGSYFSDGEFIRREGVFVVTNQNTRDKHDERFFFGEQEAQISRDVIEQYQNLIADSRETHQSDLQDRQNNEIAPETYIPSQPDGTAEKPAFSRHLYDDNSIEFPIYCYASVADDDRYGYKIEKLHPVMVSRVLFDRSPLDCLPESLRPATAINQLSPADRMFGWVNQDSELAENESEASYRSQVRVSSVRCITRASDAVTIFDSPKTLAILAQPKPQQGRFYLGDQDGHPHASDGRSKKLVGYTGTNRIRGPKVYPHHATGIEEEHAYSDDQTNQNRTIEGYVSAGTEFEFDIDVINASAVEIGALLWLLALPEKSYFRLGLGKPLGFGSVRLEILQDSILADGQSWTDSVICQSDPEQTIKFEEWIDEFRRSIEKVNPKLLSAFLKSCVGLGELPVHYPWLADKQGSEHFKWFMKNDEKGKYSLAELNGNDVSLPMNPE
ncbi:MAG: TIGR03986 family CRISPR-associated RAMP protein [Planctomycetota bacterium]